jgi:hypothetical protein
MPTTIMGLPAHALIVHATVVGVPLAALLLILTAVWPRVRRALGPLPAIAGAVALILVPITTSTGDKLKDKLGVGENNPLINRHEALAGELLPWVAAMFVAAVLVLFLNGWRPGSWTIPVPVASEAGTSGWTRSRVLTTVVSVIAVALAVIVIVEVVRIGHAGAEAVWQGIGSNGSS